VRANPESRRYALLLDSGLVASGRALRGPVADAPE
jgi:hypothetical protein